MSRLTIWQSTFLGMALAAPTLASPLFPDLPDTHWATDAVARLAAHGVIEGYPEGLFKGDRSMSRWELAMMVARSVDKLERVGQTFAQSQEHQHLKALAEALKPELEALGVRVELLENAVSTLDSRLSELEKITFYGFLDSRITMQSFRNRGTQDNSNNQGQGAPGALPYLDYAQLVGTAAAAPLRPQTHALLPVVDYRLGRALTNGTGFSSLAVLGLNIKVSPSLQAGAELAGFSSQGNSVVDAYWGVSAPYLSNPFTALAGSSQGLNNAPFSKMTLDRFWLEHTPSKTRLNLGNIAATGLDSFVYAGQPNIGVYGPRRWPGYGFQLLGRVPITGKSALSYELLGNRFGNGVRFQGISYTPQVLSGKLAYEFERGKLQANLSRLQEEAPNGGLPLGVGLTNGINVAFGTSPGWSIRQWVNPPGHFVNQLASGVGVGVGVPGNTADTRPIAGWNALSDDTVGFGLGAGNYGPQRQTTYGLSGNYSFPLPTEQQLRLTAEIGRSQFQPNRNSGYSSEGNLLRVALDSHLLETSLELGLEYLRIDPNYNPAAWSGNVTGVRFATNYNFTGTFHMHDFNKYPHNREGWRARLKYRFAEKAATVWAEGSFLQQTKTSLYDVRVTPQALAPGTPTGAVLGFSPGFVDPIFSGYAHPLIYGSNSRSSFDTNFTPLENPRGRQTDYQLGASYVWPNDGVKLTGSFQRFEYHRPSVLSAGLGGSQNLVDLKCDWFTFSSSFPLSERWRGLAGIDVVHTRGHHDPAGLFNITALASNSIDFTNIDSRQFIPHIGADWRVSDNTDFNVNLRYYDTTDRVSPTVMAGNLMAGQVGSTVHPFSWSGLQFSSQFQVRF